MTERLLVAQDVQVQRLRRKSTRAARSSGVSEPLVGPIFGCFWKANWYSM